MNASPAPPAAPPPLRVLLVDDEEPARWRLRSLVEALGTPAATVVGEAASAMQARVWLAEHACDLVLLDIALPGVDGLGFAAELRRPAGGTAAPPAIVFVTAHAEHALKAFELAAVDYLTKPVRRERLQAALQRVADQVALRRGARGGGGGDGGEGEGAAPAALVPGGAAAGGDALVLSERGRLLQVPLSEVLYLKAELKYVTVRTRRQSHLMDGSLSELESRLGPGFLRIHRNALVSLRAVRALERRAIAGADAEPGEAGETWAVRVAGVDEWLAVSRRQVPAVREALLAASRTNRGPG